MGSDAFLIETSQDLLQTKAAVNGCKQAIVPRHPAPIFVEVTVETTGTMLMGPRSARRSPPSPSRSASTPSA